MLTFYYHTHQGEKDITIYSLRNLGSIERQLHRLKCLGNLEKQKDKKVKYLRTKYYYYMKVEGKSGNLAGEFRTRTFG